MNQLAFIMRWKSIRFSWVSLRFIFDFDLLKFTFTLNCVLDVLIFFQLFFRRLILRYLSEVCNFCGILPHQVGEHTDHRSSTINVYKVWIVMCASIFFSQWVWKYYSVIYMVENGNVKFYSISIF